MTGRGIDQILPFPSSPELYESYVHDARQYVEIAERKNGEIPKQVAPTYIWGDALREWQEQRADLKIINLETAITKSNSHWRGKGINYRMHPRNVEILTAAGIAICTLANNHTLDWGYDGLTETLAVLREAGLKTCGAGESREEAAAPAIHSLAGGSRVLVFSAGLTSSGIPKAWQALARRPGVFLLENLGEGTLRDLKNGINLYRKPGDLVVFSIHWGPNWGYEVPKEHRRFAYQLIDECGGDLIHGHSSHHPLPIEVYKGKPILYGCGDFINDYEGIGGHEAYRSDLTFMYFVSFAREGNILTRLEMVPLQIKKFQLHKVSEEDKCPAP